MTIQNNTRPRQTDDFIRIQDLLYLCLSKWYWFIISLAVTIGVATAYLLTTPPVYNRSAALLIKDDGKGKSISDVSGILGGMDIFQTNTNVNNEIESLQSPSMMYDVVQRLHLNTNYSTDGTFYKQVLYGRTLPYEVVFADLRENESVSITLMAQDQGQVILSGFTLNGAELEGQAEGALNDSIETPVGRIVVKPSAYYKEVFRHPVYVSRTSISSIAAGYSARLSIALKSENSSVLNLSFRDICPQRAEEVLSTLIAVYNENWVKDKNQIAVSTSMFINERLALIETELGNVDDNISTFKSEHLLPDVQAASSMYMAQSSETNAQILALNTQLSMARYMRNYLSNATSQNQLLPANSGIESSGIEKQISEYNETLLQRNSLVRNSSEQNPLVIDIDQSLKNMRNAIIASIDNHLTSLNTRLRSLQQSEQRTTARIAANPSQAKYLLSVERQQKVKEALYLFLLQKREENELSQAFTAYNTRIITPPYGSMVPMAPVKKNILLVAFMLGIFIPVVIIFILENMNTKIRGRKDLESLTLPFAGEIPQAPKDKRRKGKSGIDYALMVSEGKRDLMNEAFRVLRTNLEFMLDADKEGNITILTSFNPSSGKTFLTMNTAASLALKNKRVLVIDGDLRRASASSYIGNPQKGLSDYLGNRTDDIYSLIVENKNYPGLYVLPVGTIPPNPTELLADSRFAALIKMLRQAYDYIFIDCPPVEIVADAQIIEKLADRTLFVIRAGLLERDMLPQLQKRYDEKSYKNMAIILNGTESSQGYSYKYGYRYGYRYGYGSKNYYNSK